MTSYGFVRFLQDGAHVTGLGAAMPEARLASLLHARGATVRLYDGKPLGSLRELSRTIARMRTDFLVLSCDVTTKALASKLSGLVRALRPTLNVIFWLQEPGGDDVPGERELTITALAPLQAANLILPTQDEPPLPPLYKDGILPTAQVSQFGLDLTLPHWALLLDYAAIRASDPDRKQLMLDAAGLSLDEIENALSALGDPGECALTVMASPKALEDPRAVAFSNDGQRTFAPIAASLADRKARARLFARNGTIAAISGLYADANKTASIYHLELAEHTDAAIWQDAFEWAAADLAVKSAAILHSPTIPTERLGPTGRSEVTQGWPRHVYALIADEDLIELTFDGESTQPRENILMVPLHAVADARPDPTQTIVLTVRESEDIDALQTLLHQMHTEGRITWFDQDIRIVFENSCRYLSYGNCRLGLMRRVQIGVGRDISTCRDAAPMSATLIDFEELVVTARRQQQTADVVRNCIVCPVRDQCSRCSQLPASWDGRYCNIRQSYPAMSLFFEIPYLLKTIGPRVARGEERPEFFLSAEALPSRYYRPGECVGKARQPVILQSSSELFAWIRGSSRLIRLSEPLALLVEGCWQRASDDELANALVRRYNILYDLAATSVVEGKAKLVKAGFIHA